MLRRSKTPDHFLVKGDKKSSWTWFITGFHPENKLHSDIFKLLCLHRIIEVGEMSEDGRPKIIKPTATIDLF